MSEGLARHDFLARSVSVLRAMANGTRLEIMSYLAQGERPVAQIELDLGIRQPILSQQLAELREAGVLLARREGKSVFYRLAGSEVSHFVVSLREVVHISYREVAVAMQHKRQRLEAK